MSTKIYCNKCEREADFDIPECLCSRHWALWWTEEYDVTPEERDAIMEEIISEMDSEKE